MGKTRSNTSLDRLFPDSVTPAKVTQSTRDLPYIDECEGTLEEEEWTTQPPPRTAASLSQQNAAAPSSSINNLRKLDKIFASEELLESVEDGLAEELATHNGATQSAPVVLRKESKSPPGSARIPKKQKTWFLCFCRG